MFYFSPKVLVQVRCQCWSQGRGDGLTDFSHFFRMESPSGQIRECVGCREAVFDIYKVGAIRTQHHSAISWYPKSGGLSFSHQNCDVGGIYHIFSETHKTGHLKFFRNIGCEPCLKCQVWTAESIESHQPGKVCLRTVSFSFAFQGILCTCQR